MTTHRRHQDAPVRVPTAHHGAPGHATGSRSIVRHGRTFAAVGIAALLATGTLVPSVTSARFSDSVRAEIVVGTDEFPCRSSVTAPFKFDQAPVVNGAGTWTRDAALCSPDHRYVAVFQEDGNFVLYDMSMQPGRSIWQTWTFGDDVFGRGTGLSLQSDGNFVLYASSGTRSRTRSTGTSGLRGPVTLTLDDDANLVLRDAPGSIRWQSRGTETTDCRAAGSFTCQPINPPWGA